MAVTVSGWKSLPKAGDEVLDASEGDIKKAIANRLRREATEALQEDAEAINESRRQEREARAEGEDAPVVPVANDDPKELRLLIKGDVSGSCEALEGALNNIGNNIAISKVIHTGVGDITESDILLAKAANGESRPFFGTPLLG
jgi:translation initiation factor IF-2